VSKCKACGETFRKGKRRMVLNFDGSLIVERVCLECVSRSVSIVTRFPRAQMTVDGLELLQRVSDRLRTMLAGASLIDAATPENVDRSFIRGRVEGLTSAVELVQRAIGQGQV
jgi:hypothetical protein